MATILTDDNGYKWGWLASEHPERLHLEVVAPVTAPRHRVYLETEDGGDSEEPVVGIH